jgi:potassium-dependent mechanosensitive channel
MIPKFEMKYGLILIIFILLVFSFPAVTQVKPLIDSAKITYDTLNSGIMNRIFEKSEDLLVKESIIKNKERHLKTLRFNLFNSIRHELNIINEYFEKGIDTAQLNNELRFAGSIYEIASDGIFINNNYPLTTRNLFTSSILMKELLKQLEVSRKQAGLYLFELGKFRNRIDSLINDTILYKIPSDASLRPEYFFELRDMVKNLTPVDSALNASINNLHGISNNLNGLIVRINQSLDIVGYQRSQFSSRMLNKELPFIWEGYGNYRNFDEVAGYSFAKNSLVLYSYAINNIILIIITCVSAFLLYLFFSALKKKPVNFEELPGINKYEPVLRYPFLTALFISLSLFQFTFAQPPVFFMGIIWLISGILLTFLKIKSIKRSLFYTWIFFFILFLFSLYTDLMLQISLFERWNMLVLAAAGLFAVVSGLKGNFEYFKTKILNRWLIFVPVAIFSVSFVLNILGRFNLAKVLLTTGYFMIITGVLLYAAMSIIEKTIFIAAEVYDTSGNERYKRKLKKLSKSLPKILNVFLVTGWMIIIARNFYFYNSIVTELFSFLRAERPIGKYNFSFENILMFILIIYLSTLVSKIISFYSDSQSTTATGRDDAAVDVRTEKTGLGNWLLLIRIATISAGVLLAFAATGIPMDRLTIILGSLGVGIGFGLQSIVGNLFSGILLAFERPIRIGDQIELEDSLGIIKEIGFRSSKLETFEGSDVIIPNSDLISKPVINWTRNNNQRRVEILLGVKYGSDLKKCKEMLERIISDHELIDESPAPMVLFNQFSGTSVDLRILFWTNLFKWKEIKSEVIFNIQNEFKKEGIVITFS